MKRTLVSCLALCALAACATSPAAPTPPVPTGAPDTVSSKVRTRADDPAVHELELTRALVDIDQRVDRYVMLTSTAGPAARDERDLLGRSLATSVAQFKSDLFALAADPSNAVRRRVAVKALAFSEDPDAVRPLVEALDATDDATLLTNATYALARLRSPTTPTDGLLALVRHPDSDVRSNALLALWHVFDAKRAIGASPLDSLEQRDAMTMLEPLLFDAADPLIRAHAAAALGALGDPHAVDALLNGLRDTHPLVRTQTAIALGKIGDTKALMPLVKLIDATPFGTPKSAVVLAVGAILEKNGHRPPDTLGDEQRAWERFVKDAMAGK